LATVENYWKQLETFSSAHTLTATSYWFLFPRTSSITVTKDWLMDGEHGMGELGAGATESHSLSTWVCQKFRGKLGKTLNLINFDG
jgi:hypothetical protein